MAGMQRKARLALVLWFAFNARVQTLLTFFNIEHMFVYDVVHGGKYCSARHERL
jgi:hypothetical protein